jgi:hypothetical protein
VFLRPLSASEVLAQYYRNDFMPTLLKLYLPFNNGTIMDYSGASGVNVLQNTSPYHRGAWPDIMGGSFPRCLCAYFWSLSCFLCLFHLHASRLCFVHIVLLFEVAFICFCPNPSRLESSLFSVSGLLVM